MEVRKLSEDDRYEGMKEHAARAIAEHPSHLERIRRRRQRLWRGIGVAVGVIMLAATYIWVTFR